MTNKIHAHVPYGRLAEHLEYAIANGINPEVFFSAEALDTLLWEELHSLSSALQAADNKRIVTGRSHYINGKRSTVPHKTLTVIH